MVPPYVTHAVRSVNNVVSGYEQHDLQLSKCVCVCVWGGGVLILDVADT